MTAEDVIQGFREDTPEDAERAAYATILSGVSVGE